MKLIQYLQKHQDKPNKEFSILSKEEAEHLFEELKELFFNYRTKKWSSIKRCQNFINSNQLKSDVFLLFLEHVFISYYDKTNRKRGQTSALGFVKALRNSNNFTSSYHKPEWVLKPDRDILDFLEAAKEYAGFYKKGSHEKMLKFLHEEVNTGLSKTTLRRYYFDKQK